MSNTPRCWVKLSPHVPEKKNGRQVFWLGDLNYRIDDSKLTYDAIHEKVAEGLWRDLLPSDQLNQQRKLGNVFAEFDEAPVTFPPTYK